MKKFITLMMAVGAFATVLAQSDARQEEAKRVVLGRKSGSAPKEDPRDVVLGRNDRDVYGNNSSRYPQSYPSASSREARINQINYEYDQKIQSIRNNRYLSQNEKERIIRQLNYERNERIRQVNDEYRRYEEDRRYNDRRRYEDDDYYYKNGKKYKKDNGKHLGWQKGKGNPHRDRY